MEKLAIKQYMANIKKGKEVIDHYIQELLDEGITYVPRFSSFVKPDQQPNNSVDSEDEVTVSSTQLDLGATASSLTLERKPRRGTFLCCSNA